MSEFARITRNPKVMGGKPCIRGMRVTVGMIAGQIRAGATADELLEDYSYLQREDIEQAIAYSETWLPCPCCGEKQFCEQGGYEICSNCDWEDDPVQSADPGFAGGANKLSLKDAKERFQKEGTTRDCSHSVELKLPK